MLICYVERSALHGPHHRYASVLSVSLWPLHPYRPAASRVRPASARGTPARAAAQRPHPRLAASWPLRWQPGYPERASPAPGPGAAFRPAAAHARLAGADRVGSVAARGGNAPDQHQPRDAQHAAEGAGGISALPVCGAGGTTWRGWRAGRVRASGAEGGLADARRAAVAPARKLANDLLPHR